MPCHQLYVIAKIGERYRVLAAAHNEFSYGKGVLKVLFNVLKTFRSEENRFGFEHEMRHAMHLRPSDWKSSPGRIPFPFITACLTLGASFDSNSADTRGVYPIPFDSEFDNQVNHTGISVLDITEPRNIRYCFVHLNSTNWIRQEVIPLLTPLTAGGYLEDYSWDWPNDRETDLKLKESYKKWGEKFKDFEVIDVRSLNSTWPRPSWQVQMQETASTDISINAPSRLRAIAMSRLAEEVLNGSIATYATVFGHASLLPDFYDNLMSSILSNSNLEKSPVARYLLSKHLEAKAVIDLSPFNLLPEHIFEILEEPAKGGVLETLNLSGNRNINESCLRQCLAKFPMLKVLWLLDTPQIPIETKAKLLRGSAVVRFHDSKIYSLPYEKGLENKGYQYPLNYDSSEMDYDSEGSDQHLEEQDQDLEDHDQNLEDRDQDLQDLDFRRPEDFNIRRPEYPIGGFYGLGYITPLVSQIMLINCWGNGTHKLRDHEGGLDIGTLLQVGLQTSSSAYYAIPFKEVNQQPRDLLIGLARFIYYSSKHAHSKTQMLSPASALAKILATEYGASRIMSPMCPSLYHDERLADCGDSALWKTTQQIVPDEWTLVVVTEGWASQSSHGGPQVTDPALRYAFISSKTLIPVDSPPAEILSNLIIADIEEVDNDLKFAEWWKRYTTGRFRYPPKFCGKEEVESVINFIGSTAGFSPAESRKEVDSVIDMKTSSPCTGADNDGDVKME